jgi:hypothetical protein
MEEETKGMSKELLEKDLISLELKCIIPILGNKNADFFLDKKNKKVLMKVKVSEEDKKLDNTQPQFVYFYIYEKNSKQPDYFGINSEGKYCDVSHGVLESTIIPQMWVPYIYNALFSSKKAVQISEDEKTYGSEKFERNFIENGDEFSDWLFMENGKLKTFIQKRPDDYGLLSWIIALIVGGKEAFSEDFKEPPATLTNMNSGHKKLEKKKKNP